MLSDSPLSPLASAGISPSLMDSKLRISAAYLSNVAWEIEPTGRRSTWTWAREAKAGLSIAHVKYYPSLLQDKYCNLTRHCPNPALILIFIPNSPYDGKLETSWYYNYSQRFQSTSDKVVGGTMLLAASVIFTYYTTWAILLVSRQL